MVLVLVTKNGSDICVVRCMLSHPKEQAETSLAAGVALMKVYLGRSRSSSVDSMRARLRPTSKRGGDRKRVVASSPDNTASDLLVGLSRTWTTPSRHAAKNEVQSVLERAIEQLPEDYAQVVTLYDLEDRPIEEVARALNRSTGATYMLRARAHDRLHEIIGRTSKFFSR